MAAFNYFISVTGDCYNTGVGAITILPSGGTPPYTVEWVEPDLGADVVEFTPSVRTNLFATTYGVRLNDSTLPINNEFYVNIPVSSGVCVSIVDVIGTSCGFDNGSVTATTTSDYSSTNFYLYTILDEYVASATTNINLGIFESLSAGTYYIVTQDLGGCEATSETFIIDDSTDFDFGLYIVPNSSCGGSPLGKIYVTGQTGTSPYYYLWSNGFTGSSITGLTAGQYSVQVKDSKGCGLTKSATITDVDPVGFGVFVAEPPSCLSNDGELSLTITGGTPPYYYSASTGAFLISYDKTFTLTNLSAGQYEILVTDAAFCSFLTGTTLSSPEGIQQVNITTINSVCSSDGGSITAYVVGGTPPITYTLVGPTGNTINVTTNQIQYSFPGLESGLYTIFVEDANGCSLSKEINLISEDKFSLNVTSTGTTCGASNGAINVSLTTGGTEPYDYYLDNANGILDTTLTAITFTNVSSGQHVVKVVDFDGCIQQSQVYVNFSEPVNFSLFSTSCGDGDSGTVTAFITSGTPPFTFNWSDNVIGNPQEIKVSGLTAGTYSLTVEDSLGCSLKRTITIDCNELYSSYQLYIMGAEEFQLQVGVKCGLLQMLNQGYFDLTSGNTGCSLVSADFTAKVTIDPSGTTYTDTFFTTNSLAIAPSDNLWYDAIQNLLLGVPGISNVTIDPIDNTITIDSDINNTLNGQQIIVELIIVYDINCAS